MEEFEYWPVLVRLLFGIEDHSVTSSPVVSNTDFEAVIGKEGSSRKPFPFGTDWSPGRNRKIEHYQ